MTNAIVRNAKAKIIERRFEDVKNDLSRLLIPTPRKCGGEAGAIEIRTEERADLYG